MLLSDRTTDVGVSPSPASPTAPPEATGWHGILRLNYGHTPTGTQIQHSYTQAPLRLQRPFYPEGPEVCQTVLVHTAGGMVGGDRLEVDLQLDAGARALLTTAAASKIYRSNGPEVQQQIQARVGPGACLEWFPQETIVFNQARYRQSQRIELAPGGQWMGWDINRLGRTAHGESLVSGEWRSRTEVWQAGKPLWIDRQWLPASAEIWASCHGLNHSPIVASFAWVGVAVDPELIQQIRQCWEACDRGNQETSQAGVSRLQKGLVCRYRGHSRAAAQRWFIQVWQLIRAHHWGTSPPRPRVWQQ